MLSQKITDWTLFYDGYELCGKAPISLYSALIDHGIIEDPYYRTNEKSATPLSEKDCEMTSAVDITEEMLEKEHLDLCFYGIDTLCDVYFNGEYLFYANNMHRTWRADIKSKARLGKNEIKLHFYSPSKYIAQENAKHYLFNSTSGGVVMEGIGHIRKAHCMFGWDWGPMLPDMGLYRDVTLDAYDVRIDDVSIRQRHENKKATLCLTLAPSKAASDITADVTITEPNGKKAAYTLSIYEDNEIEIPSPMLWWPNGLGKQPLYTLSFKLYKNGKAEDEVRKTVGLRTLTVSTEKDGYGEEFCFVVNGKKFFSMGADYIPEESIIPYRSAERTEKLIRSCVLANFNSLRVWGGGTYPDDCFYELCDKYGIIVWQDFMFACVNVLMTKEFEENIRAEFCDVLRRIRHHACIGLLCGNNEMELALVEWSSCLRSKTQKVVDDYLLLYENVIPEVCGKYAPDIFYWPASPSSRGGFDDPNNENVGDTHYWKVWHGGVPFEEYRKHFFRYCSEFGFEAFPSMKTIKSFALPCDMALDSPVMLSHQKCLSGNEKILNYVKDYYDIPNDFSHFVYISQLLQADAIRYGVEHFRRFRGRCMGALYWQLNDCWPTVSWASVDYFGRWKALHHRAKKFFAPILVSLHEDGESKIANISNETLENFRGVLRIRLKNNDFDVISEFEEEVEVPALSANDISIPKEISRLAEQNKDSLFLEYTLSKDGEVLERDGKIYAKPRDYRFEDPEISASVTEENGEFYLDITAKRYARSVFIEWENANIFLQDNFFDITDKTVRVRLSGKKEDILSEMPKILSVYDVQ